MTLAFTLWTQAKKPTGEFDLIDSDDRGKIKENIFRWFEMRCPSNCRLFLAKLIIRAFHGHYGVKRISDLPRRKLRSALIRTSHWNDDVVWKAVENGDASALVPAELIERLGLNRKHRSAVQRVHEALPAHFRMMLPSEDKRGWIRRRAAFLGCSHELQDRTFAEMIVHAAAEFERQFPTRRPSSDVPLRLVYSRD